MGLRSTIPRIIKYSSRFYTPSGLVSLGQFQIMVLTTAIPFSSIERIDLPAFRPNDYFWKNHQKPDEEKWQTYKRVMEDIMSEHGGLECINAQIEDKFEYKKVLKSKKQASTGDSQK